MYCSVRNERTFKTRMGFQQKHFDIDFSVNYSSVTASLSVSEQYYTNVQPRADSSDMLVLVPSPSVVWLESHAHRNSPWRYAL